MSNTPVEPEPTVPSETGDTLKARADAAKARADALESSASSIIVQTVRLRDEAEEGKVQQDHQRGGLMWPRIGLVVSSAFAGVSGSTAFLSNVPTGLKLLFAIGGLLASGLAGLLARRDPITEERQAQLASAAFASLARRAAFFLSVDAPLLEASIKPRGDLPNAEKAYKELRDAAVRMADELANIEAGTVEQYKPSTAPPKAADRHG